MAVRTLCVFFLIEFLIVSNLWAVASTSGVPIGGFGTGYVKYNAKTGDFAASSKIPPAAGDMVCEFPGKMSSSSGFHFYAGGQAVTKAKTDNEDAKFPLYIVDYGKTNNVNFSLFAFGPSIPGNTPLNIKLASSPLALFEITAKNEGSAAVDVAVALEFTNKSTTIASLLGGMADAAIDATSATAAISYATSTFNDIPSNPNNSGNAYLTVTCDTEGATYSAGAIGTFSTTGALANTNGNAVAAKCSIPAGGSAKFKFTMAWWRTFVSGTDRYGVGKNDADDIYYHNFYQNSKEAATFGAQNFDAVRNAIVLMVSRVNSCNFPAWYKDRLLNNCYPLVNNSFWAKDGRAAFWEGGYGIIGTIDQGQHAGIWYAQNWTENQMCELKYWLGNMHTGVGEDPSLKGQIHHDFNTAPGVTFDPPESRFMAPWDHYLRDDYWFQPNTTDWSDLNSMLIFKAYEVLLCSGDTATLKTLFPKIVVVADRLYAMSQEAGAYIPIQSKSTYDSHGIITPQYSCGVAVAAYQIIREMAKLLGDAATLTKYTTIYTNARAEYKTRLFNGDFGVINIEGWAEGHVGGYSWANYFCLEPIMDKDFIETACDRLWSLYSQESTLNNKVGGWHFYTYDHLGGALTAIGRPDTALQFHKWDHTLYFENNPDLVFWQTLFSKEIGPQKYSSYMTAPSVWRSYFQFTGYLLDNAHQRLWIRPSIPSQMNKQLTNCPLPNPHGWGMLNYNGNGDASKSLTQMGNVTFDVQISIKELILKNNTGGNTPFVIIDNNGERLSGYTTAAEDWGIEQNIRITFPAAITVGPTGLAFQVYSKEIGVTTGKNGTHKPSLAIISSSLVNGKPISCSIDKPGNVTLDLFALNGAKIGILIQKRVTTAGCHSFEWNGQTINGKHIGNTAGILRLSSPNGTVSRMVYKMSK